MASGPTVINIVPEFGIPIRIEVNRNTVRVSGAETVLAEFPFAKGEGEIGGFVFANDSVDLAHASGALVVRNSRNTGRRGMLEVVVNGELGQSTYDKPRLEAQGSKKGIRVVAHSPEDMKKRSVHLADIKD